MPFGKDDFNKENAQRLSVIIMPQMKRHPLFSFRELNERDKTKFNKLMNAYIQTHLAGDDWEAKLHADFNDICNDEIFTDDLAPERMFVPQITEPQMVFKDDTEREWYESTLTKEVITEIE